ncbi:MAG: YHS domain-containing protein, partial [Candidatus Omnitrophica bacterium]|nr:YHS domain-containing protein [Candidatus Omnitrophota bacterium]
TVEYKGKLYNLCCPGCISRFKADPEKYSKIAQDEVTATQSK